MAFVHLDPIAPGQPPLRIEHTWIAPERRDAPLLVFLHEGLGSLSMWRDYPARLCEAAGCRGLVYSRPGYGRSTPRAPGTAWTPRFMHEQAQIVLPAFFEAVGLDADHDPPWLFGHSDGGSIALLHAAAYPARTAGLIVLAPHILVEDLSVASIARAREAYLHTELRGRLARHHDDPDSAFWGWNDVWLHPDFRAWSIEAELAPSPAPCWPCRGWTTSTAPSSRSAASRGACRVPSCWNCPLAAIRRTATSPMRSRARPAPS
jgi:pimeloyl-ACP methyl ester carboxylesterase